MRLPRSAATLGKFLDAYYVELESAGPPKKLVLRRYVLAGDVDGRTIWLVPAPTKKLDESPDDVPAAAKLRRLWSKLEPDSVEAVTPKTGRDVPVGRMVKIGYRSDKWNRARTEKDYEHEYRSRPLLTKSGEIYRISGGKQVITRRGIDG
jgi:hypothetical protein